MVACVRVRAHVHVHLQCAGDADVELEGGALLNELTAEEDNAEYHLRDQVQSTAANNNQQGVERAGCCVCSKPISTEQTNNAIDGRTASYE